MACRRSQIPREHIQQRTLAAAALSPDNREQSGGQQKITRVDCRENISIAMLPEIVFRYLSLDWNHRP